MWNSFSVLLQRTVKTMQTNTEQTYSYSSKVNIIRPWHIWLWCQKIGYSLPDMMQTCMLNFLDSGFRNITEVSLSQNNFLSHSTLWKAFPQMSGRKWPLNMVLSGFALQCSWTVCVQRWGRVVVTERNSDKSSRECQGSPCGNCSKHLKLNTHCHHSPFVAN